MNREFHATSKLARSILAVTAVLSTVLVIGSIDMLAQHYGTELQAAAAPTVLIARH
jgi:hypothetical protein